MSGNVDQRLGFSAQFEQARHGWQLAQQRQSAADGAAWLTALHGIIERTNRSEALRTIENSYHEDLRGLAATVGGLAESAGGVATPAPDFWERGEQAFERAFMIIDGSGL